MSSWLSKDGVWFPQNEKVGLVNHGAPFNHPKTGEIVSTGDPYIYEGPCRAALFELWEEDKTGKTVTKGADFRKSPVFLQMLRDLNFKSADEYLAWVGYDAKEAEEKFKTTVTKIEKHELPRRVAEIKRLGGGSDTATGKQNKYGGFGDPNEAPVPAAQK